MEQFQTYIVEILILIFLIITYSLSGIEKVSDWNGNITFIKEHFKNSILKNYVPLLLSIILVLELLSAAFMFIGIFYLILMSNQNYALFGLEISALTLIFLLIGQRLAKDYEGAMSLTVYFILTVFGIYLLNS